MLSYLDMTQPTLRRYHAIAQLHGYADVCSLLIELHYVKRRPIAHAAKFLRCSRATALRIFLACGLARVPIGARLDAAALATWQQKIRKR